MKKIIEYIKNHKKSFIGGLVVVIIIVGFICCSIKPKALAFDIDYQDFNFLCGVSHTEVDSSDLLVDLEVIAYISNNKLVYDIDSYGSARLINGDESEILVDNVYLIKYDLQGGIIERYVLFDDFIADSNSSYYNDGYNTSSTDNSSASYNQGYTQGYNQARSDSASDYDSVIQNYNDIIANQNNQIDDLTDALEDANRGFKFATFSQLLGAIVTYPVRFFKEGLNVEVFGINVGAFVVAIVFVSIALGVTAVILGRRRS